MHAYTHVCVYVYIYIYIYIYTHTYTYTYTYTYIHIYICVPHEAPAEEAAERLGGCSDVPVPERSALVKNMQIYVSKEKH